VAKTPNPLPSNFFCLTRASNTLSCFLLGLKPAGILRETATDVIIGLFAIIVPPVVTIKSIWPEIKTVFRILQTGGDEGEKTIREFLNEHLTALLSLVADLRGDGARMDIYQVATWVRMCFRTASGRYVGTDSNVPSDYKQLYGDYLRAHEEYLKRTRHTDSVRVLIADLVSLREDKLLNSEDFDWFYTWHRNNQVDLRRLDPQRAKKIATDCSLETTDIGFWEGEFALFFRPSVAEQYVVLKMAFPGEPAHDRCKEFANRLLEEATAISQDIPLFVDTLSDNWELFIHPKERLRKEGPFLSRVLARFGAPNDVWVIDAAAGIGVETAWLINSGFNVIANEIESSLRKKASQYAQQNGIRLPMQQFTQANWLDFDHAFQHNSFHVILVLGNSLCLLANSREVKHALRNFYKILKPGGVLIVDERNFQYILDKWEDIAKDPKRNFRYSREVMYCGDIVQGFPTRKTRERVIFTYFKRTNSAWQEIGQLSMLPFKRGQLLEWLKESGFSEIEIYCDLEDDPSNTFKETSDFYTYVATKPTSS